MALALRSKTGCLKCRRRRVKCDEARPTCQRCHRAGLDCVWPGRVHVTSSHLQSITTLGNLYASLFLQNGLVDYSGKHPLNPIQVCPAKQISPGYPPLRSAQEHHSLIKLTLFLRVLSFDKFEDNLPFELSVALQELWVRDALLAAATFVGGAHEKCELWSKVDPYYTSASKAIRHYIAVGDLDEVRMEQLLVASQFLGMIEINNPHNEIFPLLHFEAVGRLLKTLKTIQTTKVLPEATKRFHRIAFESYIYHISIQALFWPQTERYVTLSEIHEEYEHDLSRQPHENIIVKLDLNIYMILFRLSRLAKTRSLNPAQQAQADELVTRIQQMEETAIRNDVLPRPPESNPRRPNFAQMTILATSVLAILAAKVHDRTLLATTPSLRPLVAKALSRLEQCQPFRAWTGDFTWIFTILLCAVSTSDEVERLSRKLQTFAQGFLGSDLRRMKKVLELVRARRVAMTRRAFTDPDKEEDIRSSDTLDLLVEARLALSW